MGVDTAPQIAAALVEHGRAADTPVAVVADGSTPEPAGRPDDAGRAGADAGREAIRPPAVWVVGEVVALGAARLRPRQGSPRPAVTPQ